MTVWCTSWAAPPPPAEWPITVWSDLQDIALGGGAARANGTWMPMRSEVRIAIEVAWPGFRHLNEQGLEVRDCTLDDIPPWSETIAINTERAGYTLQRGQPRKQRALVLWSDLPRRFFPCVVLDLRDAEQADVRMSVDCADLPLFTARSEGTLFAYNHSRTGRWRGPWLGNPCERTERNEPVVKKKKKSSTAKKKTPKSKRVPLRQATVLCTLRTAEATALPPPPSPCTCSFPSTPDARALASCPVPHATLFFATPCR